MRYYAVIYECREMVLCCGVYTDYLKAVGKALTNADQIMDGEEYHVRPMQELEGEGGMYFDVECIGNPGMSCRMLVLDTTEGDVHGTD